jgi:hypothetical protein
MVLQNPTHVPAQQLAHRPVHLHHLVIQALRHCLLTIPACMHTNTCRIKLLVMRTPSPEGLLLAAVTTVEGK